MMKEHAAKVSSTRSGSPRPRARGAPRGHAAAELISAAPNGSMADAALSELSEAASYGGARARVCYQDFARFMITALYLRRTAAS